MQVQFHLGPGHPEIGLEFVWRLKLDGTTLLSEHIIPEPYFDYYWVDVGALSWQADSRVNDLNGSSGFLRPLFLGPMTLHFQTPAVVWGARFNLRFAEQFSVQPGRATWQPVDWLKDAPPSLPALHRLLITKLTSQLHPVQSPIFEPDLSIRTQFTTYSARHRRRLFRKAFGISRQDLARMLNVQAFLDQACNFGQAEPKIIQYVNDEVFYDQPHLNHTFKRMTGLSPLDFFEKQAILQDNLMAASYNVRIANKSRLGL